MQILCNDHRFHLDFLCAIRTISAGFSDEQFADPAADLCGPRGKQGAGVTGSKSMLDLILLVGGLGLFALSIAYAYGCDLL
jgi:hypothetical protein